MFFQINSNYGAPPLGPKTWLSWLAALLLSGISFLPMFMKRGIASFLSTIYTQKFGSGSRHVKTVQVNLQACYPNFNDAQRNALVHEYFSTLMQAVFQMPQQWWRSERYLRRCTHFYGEQELIRAREEGNACTLLITHTVSLDAGMIALSLDMSLTGFYKPFNNDVVDWLVRRSRLRFGGKPFARGEGFREIIRQMKQGETLCYLCDEDYGAKASVFAPFFGHEKATLKMLPKIVKHTNSKVFPMATYLNRETGHYDVYIQPAIEGYPTGNERDDAALINEAIVNSIKAAPEQYLWKLQLFKTCPNGGDSRYQQVARGDLQAEEL